MISTNAKMMAVLDFLKLYRINNISYKIGVDGEKRNGHLCLPQIA